MIVTYVMAYPAPVELLVICGMPMTEAEVDDVAEDTPEIGEIVLVIIVPDPVADENAEVRNV